MRATPRSCPAVTAFFVWSAAAPVHPRQPPRVAVGGATAVTRLPPPGPPVGHRHASRRRSRRAVLASAAAADGGGAAAGRPAPVAAAAAAAAAIVMATLAAAGGTSPPRHRGDGPAACGTCGVLGRRGGGCRPRPAACVPAREVCAASRSRPRRYGCVAVAEAEAWAGATPPGPTGGGVPPAVAATYLRTIRNVYTPLAAANRSVPLGIVTSGVVRPGTFARTVAGRIRPLGVYDSLEGTLEYFYGIITSGTARAVSFGVSQFLVSPPYAYAKVDFVVSNDATGRSVTASHAGVWRFNAAGLVTGYDLELPRMTASLAAIGINYTDPAFVATALIPRVCAVVGRACTGRHRLWGSAAECAAYLATRRIADGYAEGDNFGCRALHAPLTVWRPDLHCKHVGEDGGGKCVDRPLRQLYDDDVRILGYPWLAPAAVGGMPGVGVGAGAEGGA